MKKTPLNSILLTVTAVSAILSFILVGWTFYYARQAGGLRNQVVFINNTRPMINNLAIELNEYSKKNPSIDPILISAQFKRLAAPATQPAPVTRPATR